MINWSFYLALDRPFVRTIFVPLSVDGTKHKLKNDVLKKKNRCCFARTKHRMSSSGRHWQACASCPVGCEPSYVIGTIQNYTCSTLQVGTLNSTEFTNSLNVNLWRFVEYTTSAINKVIVNWLTHWVLQLYHMPLSCTIIKINGLRVAVFQPLIQQDFLCENLAYILPASCLPMLIETHVFVYR